MQEKLSNQNCYRQDITPWRNFPKLWPKKLLALYFQTNFTKGERSNLEAGKNAKKQTTSMKTLTQIFVEKKSMSNQALLSWKNFSIWFARTSAVYNRVISVKNLYFIYFHVLFLFSSEQVQYIMGSQVLRICISSTFMFYFFSV